MNWNKPSKDSIECGYIVYSHGFGIKWADNEDPTCLIAEFDKDDDINPSLAMLNTIKALTHSDSLEKTESWGCFCLKIHWKESHMIPSIYNILLKYGYRFRLSNRLSTTMLPYDWPLTPEKMDRIYIREIEYRGAYASGIAYLTDSWNWRTDEGKVYARNLRMQWHIPPEDHKDNYWEWPMFQSTESEAPNFFKLITCSEP